MLLLMTLPTLPSSDVALAVLATLSVTMPVPRPLAPAMSIVPAAMVVC